MVVKQEREAVAKLCEGMRQRQRQRQRQSWVRGRPYWQRERERDRVWKSYFQIRRGGVNSTAGFDWEIVKKSLLFTKMPFGEWRVLIYAERGDKSGALVVF